MNNESGADQPAAQIGDTPAPGTLAETNALLRELVTAATVVAAEVASLRQVCFLFWERQVQCDMDSFEFTKRLLGSKDD